MSHSIPRAARTLALAGTAAAFLLCASPAVSAQVTGLSGWSLYIDQGHSENENMGIFNYSEARKTLRVGLYLRDMLTSRTDVGAVYTSRTTDQQQVSLTQRTDQANSLGASFFHSIHSNAGGPATNNVLMLYGGWRLNGQTIEKTPNGGGRMGDKYETTVSGAMELPTIGNYADRTFYQGFPDTHANQWPYLHVNRESNMASVLSENGFHTNPRQNQLNMNAEWKKKEAQAFYWGILDYHNIPRSVHRIATGIVADAESGRPINGATITADGQTYTTDTYASLFNQYSPDPNLLANGFYYLEGMPAGSVTVSASAAGYEPAASTLAVNETDFSELDFALVSNVAPVVASSSPEQGETNVLVTDRIDIVFSRKMDPATTIPALTFQPAVAGTGQIVDNGYRLQFTPSANLQAQTAYTMTLAGSALGIYGDALDGNGDGTAGDAYVVSFVSGFPDSQAPTVTQAYPSPNATGVELRPVVGVVFNEPVLPSSLTGRVNLQNEATQTAVPGRFEHTLAGDVGAEPLPRSVVSFAPDAPLLPNTLYRMNIEAGVVDLYQNETTSRRSFTFRTGSVSATAVSIDGFEGTSIADNWWLPQQSGSTAGIVTDSTARSAATDVVNLLGGTRSMRMDYGWDATASAWLIRQYLNGGAPRNVFFDSEKTLQAYVYGDGTGTLFRFAVDDGPSSHEVSPWFPVTWYGWRPVSWDLSGGQFGTWIGNGQWDSPTNLRIDSIQLSYDGTSPRFGHLYVDDLRYVTLNSVSSEDGAERMAEALTVFPSRPNPLQFETKLPFGLRDGATVSVRVYNALGQEVAVLANAEPFAPGVHELTWDARSMAAGVYVARVEAGDVSKTVQMVVVR